ncbi:MAG TPA: DUF4118 domain-containing protein [Polyangiaceae bacterium]|nr:DUF4118 domain-containing protein [Polyangiaceae bacterium]
MEIEPQYLARQNVTVVLRRSTVGVSLLAAIAFVALGTVVCHFAVPHRPADVVMMYLLGVVVVAMRFGYVASLATAVLSVAAFDFFFTPPYLSFAVADKGYFVTFAIMLFVAFTISNLMQRIRRSAAHVREREVRTSRLYAMSREVSIARSSEDIVRVACRHLHDTFASDVSILLPDGGGGLRRAGMAPPEAKADVPPISAPLAEAALALIGGKSLAGDPGSSFKLPSGEELIGLRASSGVVGVLVIHPIVTELFANPANRELLDAYASQTSLAVERAQLAENAQRAQLEVQKERLRNALLSSVSHDLRTPLAVVKGAVTALLDPRGEMAPTRRREYLETISDEANRLNRLVRNLLNMTSLEAGALTARKEWQPLEEVVGVALNRLEEPLGGRPIRVEIAPDAAIVPFDATLLEQVLLNLVENATRYTPEGSPIDIRATRVEGGVQVEVADRGPGVPAGREEEIFQKFRRAGSPHEGGMGLGLTICRGIITVHGGRIWCENRPGGGATFRFVLPREQDVPMLDGLPEAIGEA